MGCGATYPPQSRDTVPKCSGVRFTFGFRASTPPLALERSIRFGSVADATIGMHLDRERSQHWSATAKEASTNSLIYEKVPNVRPCHCPKFAETVALSGD